MQIQILTADPADILATLRNPFQQISEQIAERKAATKAEAVFSLQIEIIRLKARIEAKQATQVKPLAVRNSKTYAEYVADDRNRPVSPHTAPRGARVPTTLL